jgi:hypothetical protein
MNSEKIDIEALNELYEKHHECGKQVFSCCNGICFPMDLYTFSALDRSLHNLAGFQILLENDNYLCALPILRMQLDTLMRYWAFTLVQNAHEFADEVLKGMPIRKIKDRCNKALTDVYIVEQLNKSDPWIKHVYDFCCNYVHFSEAHIKAVIDNSPKTEDGTYRNIHLTIKDKNVPISHKNEAIDAFKLITEGLFETIQLWTDKIRNVFDEQELKRRFTSIA